MTDWTKPLEKKNWSLLVYMGAKDTVYHCYRCGDEISKEELVFVAEGYALHLKCVNKYLKERKNAESDTKRI
jgi:hypothetical protein